MAGRNRNYLQLTKQVTELCGNHNLTDCMVIGTSPSFNINIPSHTDGRGARFTLFEELQKDIPQINL